jgi:hypothetical protein
MPIRPSNATTETPFTSRLVICIDPPLEGSRSRDPLWDPVHWCCRNGIRGLPDIADHVVKTEAVASFNPLRDPGHLNGFLPRGHLTPQPHDRTKLQQRPLLTGSGYGTNRCAIGKGRPNPKAREVIFNPGAACFRLYSLRSTSSAISFTSFNSNPYLSAMS